MTKDGSVSVWLDPMLHMFEWFHAIDAALNKYSDAWRAKQDQDILRHAVLKFRFAGYHETEKGLYADYTAYVEKF